MVRRNVNDVNLFGLDDLISAGGLRYWVEKLKSNFKSGFFILRSALINPTYITTASKLFISPIIAYHFQPVLSQILSHHKIFKDPDRTAPGLKNRAVRRFLIMIIKDYAAWFSNLSINITYITISFFIIKFIKRRGFMLKFCQFWVIQIVAS